MTDFLSESLGHKTSAFGLECGVDPSTWTAELDGVCCAPCCHTVLYEDDQIRILDVRVEPGHAEPVHVHILPGVLTYVTDCEVSYLAFDHDGEKWVPRESAEKRVAHVGYTRLIPPEPPHSVSNHADRPARAIRVEMKPKKNAV